MKEKEFQFYIINLPIVGNKRENASLYEDFFKSIYKKRKPVLIARDKAAILRTMTISDDKKVIYGNISTFNKIGKDWLNIDKMEKESYELPKNLFPNLRESYYFFIPKFHRLVLMKTSGGITLGNALKYFMEVRRKNITDHEFDVHFEVSKDAIKEIYNADLIKTLKISISYSNADIGDAAFKFVDRELKASNTEFIEINAKTKSQEGINLEGSKILKGSLGLSASYGTAEASIIKNSRKKIVKTEDYPFLLKLRANFGDMTGLYTRVFDRLRDYLRDE